ncbi:hypothetical protein GARC_4168 [Paraglaciecola arctica BSs20135]|uniref:Uncharacterized protein n=1 Tax=Paraglaciecola arctica BSs20135 TaxID=493475 RepID=K6ZCF5_9ALTE|nr:hypothetical protein GARC_4168 [Paraglaciecola arctica BSs20135]
MLAKIAVTVYFRFTGWTTLGCHFTSKPISLILGLSTSACHFNLFASQHY